jgi:hypothetical protein
MLEVTQFELIDKPSELITTPNILGRDITGIEKASYIGMN